jgi:hypothetical protein
MLSERNNNTSDRRFKIPLSIYDGSVQNFDWTVPLPVICLPAQMVSNDKQSGDKVDDDQTSIRKDDPQKRDPQMKRMQVNG